MVSFEEKMEELRGYGFDGEKIEKDGDNIFLVSIVLLE